MRQRQKVAFIEIAVYVFTLFWTTFYETAVFS